MYLSGRELYIITIMLEQPSGVSVQLLSDRLEISRRTIYRDLSQLEQTLIPLKIALVKDSKGYKLQGDSKHINQLRMYVMNTTVELEYTPKQRQRMLVIQLLLAQEVVKIDYLAHILRVSASTIQSDLQSIEETFNDYGIRIDKKKGVGIKANADEKSLRLIVSGLITIECNEFDFFTLFDDADQLDSQKYEMVMVSNPFLSVIYPSILEKTYQLIRQYEKFQFDEVTDTQLQTLIVLLSLTIMRIQEGYMIHQIDPIDDSLVQRQISEKLATQVLDGLAHVYTIRSIPKSEVLFLARQIDSINVPFSQEFSNIYDIRLIYNVRTLIQTVSNDMQYDFRQDKRLFNDLLAHMNAVLTQEQPPIYKMINPFIHKIYEEFTSLSETVYRQLEQVFTKSKFSKVDALYVVIHFVASYERERRDIPLRVLIICSSGIGTAKILENRVRKHISSVTDITVSRVSQLSQMVLDHYDIILSTIFLQGFKREYKVVTPLMMDDEVAAIQVIAEKVIRQKKTGNQAAVIDNPKTYSTVSPSFKKIYDTILTMEQLLCDFGITLVDNQPNLQCALQEICKLIYPDIILDIQSVVDALMDRIALSSVGIPDTHMALCHAINQKVTRGYFGIFDLSQPIQMVDFLGEEQEISRVLLMLGPDPIPSITQEVLGSISGAIIEKNEQLCLFNTGGQDAIHNYMTKLFLSIIKKREE